MLHLLNHPVRRSMRADTTPALDRKDRCHGARRRLVSDDRRPRRRVGGDRPRHGQPPPRPLAAPRNKTRTLLVRPSERGLPGRSAGSCDRISRRHDRVAALNRWRASQPYRHAQSLRPIQLLVIRLTTNGRKVTHLLCALQAWPGQSLFEPVRRSRLTAGGRVRRARCRRRTPVQFAREPRPRSDRHPKCRHPDEHRPGGRSRAATGRG